VPRAEALPVGTTVIHRGRTIRRVGNIALQRPWYGHSGAKYSHTEVDKLLATGAKVLGPGEEGASVVRLESAAARGRCRVCDRPDIRINKDGALRHHAGRDRGPSASPEREYRCPGSGQLPKGS
jgi:hypothetical protein